MRRTQLLFLMAAAAIGCGSSTGTNTGSGGMGGAGAVGGASGVTFWQDVAPIYNQKCVPCHQEGGLGPFRLDTYPDALAFAADELAMIQAGAMPPYFMVHDDSCGSFEAAKALSAAEKGTIAAWVQAGAPQGTPVTLSPPEKPTLAGAVDVRTPLFSPVAQGGQQAEHDEYRCFALDAPNTKDGFVIGYDVSPGEASIVHHVIVFVVDPAAKGGGNMTNAAAIKALDDASPDRLGWPCFGGAGDNLKVDSIPVTWAPGQGVVNYPDGLGVPLPATRKLIVQVHYNLVDPASVGKMDQTTVHLRFADQVNRKLAFLLPDPFLGSLGNTTPDSLPAGQADAKYTWTRTGQQVGLSGVASAELVAVMPHMHGRGMRQTMTLSGTCASHLEGWDFHWQEFYFYKTRPTLTPATQIQVTCEYDTSGDTAAVLPGWGTQNEMCLNVLMLALPAGT